MASDLVSTTMNPFTTQATLEEVDRVIESEVPITLTRRESIRLLELLENPPTRNDKFLQAQARYLQMKSHAGAAPE